jgi:hypothetical protein
VVPVRWDKTRLEELPFHVNPRTTGPYGGWLTAPLDVVRVLDALGGSDAYLSNKLMTRAARDEMWGFVASSKGSAPLTPTPVMNVVSPGGWSKTGPRLGHGGSGFGGVSTAVRFHDKKLSYCVAFNIWVPQNTIWNTATMLPLSLGRIEVLEDKIFDVQDAGGFSGPDLWPAAGITEPIG